MWQKDKNIRLRRALPPNNIILLGQNYNKRRETKNMNFKFNLNLSQQLAHRV